MVLAVDVDHLAAILDHEPADGGVSAETHEFRFARQLADLDWNYPGSISYLEVFEDFVDLLGNLRDKTIGEHDKVKY